jgi:hypothetical protein
LLGHKHIEQTTIYVHLRRHDLARIISPLDAGPSLEPKAS